MRCSVARPERVTRTPLRVGQALGLKRTGRRRRTALGLLATSSSGPARGTRSRPSTLKRRVIRSRAHSPPARSSNSSLALKVTQDITSLTFAGLPVAAGIAFLRYRPYDIDLLINRTLVYGSLTVALALMYFGGVATTLAILHVREWRRRKHPHSLASLIKQRVFQIACGYEASITG